MRELRLALRDLWALLREAARGMSRDRASTMGAALAYYTAFSLAPTLVIALAVAGLFFDDRQAEGALMEQLRSLVGPNGAQAIQAMLRSAHYEGGGLLSTAVSTAALVIGATTVFAELRRDLNRVWQAEDLAPKGVWATVRSRLLSFGLTLGIGFLLVVSLLMSAAVAAITRFWGAWLGGVEAVLHLFDLATSFLLVTLLFAMIYKLLPNRRIAWRDVWLGAAVTAFLFAAGKILIGLYLGRSSLSSSFGAAGTFVVLLVWIYYSTQIFFFGAEFTYAFAHRHGSRSGRSGRYEGPERRLSRDPGRGAGLRRHRPRDRCRRRVRRSPHPGCGRPCRRPRGPWSGRLRCRSCGPGRGRSRPGRRHADPPRAAGRCRPGAAPRRASPARRRPGARGCAGLAEGWLPGVVLP